MKAVLIIVLIIFTLLCSGKKFRWCTLSDLEQRKCAELSKALTAVLPVTNTDSFARISCIRAHNTYDCIDKIRVNKADAASLDAGDVYSAVKLYGLTVVAKEIYEQGNCVFAVAVAKRGTLDIQRLRGVRSCHNGARWTSGWNIPLGFLLARNDLSWDEGQPLSQVISEYFNASCIPGVGVAAPQLCALCQGQKSYIRDKNHFCETSSNEPFYDSDGAFRCLKDGVADVAFLDHLTIMRATESEQQEYELLCPDGTTAELSKYNTCNLGKGPGRGIITRHNFQKITNKFLTMIQRLFGRKGKERARFELFNSSSFGGKNLLFRDATQHLQLLEEQLEIAYVLGLDYVALLKGLGHEGSSLDNSVVRWCCISNAELRKCEEWALSIKSDPLVCVQATSMASCIEMIKSSEADAVTLDATHVYIAGRCGLVPVAAECYVLPCNENDSSCKILNGCLLSPGQVCAPADESTEEISKLHLKRKGLSPVYAVALAKKNAKQINIHNLRGRRSCHSHLYSPGGWLLLSRYTVGPLENVTENCDIGSVYQNYFWKGCMPGADGNLCKVCIGDSEVEGARVSSRCAASHNEHYYGNMGALRCLVGNPSGRSFGDVAFLEHSNLLWNIENLESSGWAKGYTAVDFELLCPDGTRAAVTEWAGCNLGPVPPSTVMTRPVTVTKIHDFLMKSQEFLETKLDSEFHLFQSQKYGESDLLFKDATQYLVPATHMSYQEILGEPFFQLAESVFNCTPAGILDFCKQDICASSSI
ncbi:melanotransferrin-like isoform X1 [Lagopus muta]|uniref:melanotransferrin-like isoform X1 n=1 Tax=Lagopus muta TaxID=64668 RepID=UPI00209E9BEC|nr:melanotransferrin-like isoform X1 [Lagopus muta]XP_048819698.1 melanotransferrin-like isoform X1 [Lagopus muta]XP_048819699.1 melanotransferrin-like isoform X1 [Lagopus muta]XP_048819700.1 melanotransferrin-like isoform X1 [Lagopus muta]XP_048819701.1 melanotransferrin-like isoform X1 [Lagopus muta]XP_048819702.1 melanotransferrin-like isoform X1 [Lagopus muta]XP_048819704.1 melanotransferrin-like isoform X1 [Lagopus muta]